MHASTLELHCLHSPTISDHFKSTCLLVSSADNLCKQFGPRSGQTNVRPDLDPNCLAL